MSTLTQPGWHRAAGNGHPLRPDLLHALCCTCSSKWAAHQRPSSPRPEVNISTPSASHLAASLPYSLACATGPAVFRMFLRFSTRAYLQNTGCSRDGPECRQQAGRSLCGPLLWGSLCVVAPRSICSCFLLSFLGWCSNFGHALAHFGLQRTPLRNRAEPSRGLQKKPFTATRGPALTQHGLWPLHAYMERIY